MQDSTDKPAWARNQSERTLEMMGSNGPRYNHYGLHFADGDQHRSLPSITRLGGKLYETLSNKRYPRGCWRRTTIQQYRTGDNAWEVVVDVGQLNTVEHAEWVLLDVWSLPPKHQKAVVQLWDVATNTYALREWDLVHCEAVTYQAFSLTTMSPSEVAWLDENSLLLMSTLGRGDHQTQAGEAGTHQIMSWRKRFVTGERSMKWWCMSMLKPPRQTSSTWVNEMEATKTSLWVVRGGYLVILLKEDWSLNESNYEAGTIVGVWIRQPFADNIQPVQLCDASGFQGAFLDREHLVVLFCRNLRYSIRVFKPADGWLEVATQHLPPGEVMSITALDCYANETDSALLLTSQGPLTPPTFWTSTGPGGAFELLRQAPTTFNTAGYSRTDYQTTNANGESIPYIVVGPPGAPAEQPVCLIFCSPDMKPGYSTTLGQRWLEPGGAIIFVPSDYSNTISSITDATCIVTDLVTNDVTTPDRVAVLGAFEHGAALMEMYPVSEGIFAAFGSYNPRWSSSEAFRGAGRHIQRHKGAQQHHLLVGCNSLSDPLDTRWARRLSAMLQSFEYRVNYYESGMDEFGGLEDPDFLLTLQLEFFSQKIGWIRETVPALPYLFA